MQDQGEGEEGEGGDRLIKCNRKHFATLGTHVTLQVVPNVGTTITTLKVNTRPGATPNIDIEPSHQ